MVITKKSYPLTIGQQSVILQQCYAIDKSISNISIAVHFEKEIDDAVMMQAITNALYRNHSSSIQIRKINESTYEQYFSFNTPDSIEIVDFRDASQEDLEKYLKEQAATEFPNDGYDVPLYRLKYIFKPDGLAAVYFVVSHICFDAYSMMFLAQDAFNIYDCLKHDKPLPKTFLSPELYFEKEQEYFVSPQFMKDKAFWDQDSSTEPRYTNLHGKGGFGYFPDKRCGRGSFGFEWVKSNTWYGRIPAELVNKVNKFAYEHGVSVQGLYLLALRNALSKANENEEDITILNILARRATKLEKEAGGSRVSAFPLRMNFSNELTIVEAIREISSNLYSYFKHSELPYPFIAQMNMQKFNLQPGEGYFAMTLTFQPYIIKASEDLPFHLQYIGNGQSAMPCYLTLMAVDNSGDLMGIYEYNLTMYPTSEKIEEHHDYMLRMLAYVVDHPEAKVLELLTEL